MRLDNYLATKKLAQSRNKAQELIKNSKVLVDGKIIVKPSFEVVSPMSIEVSVDVQYVSRAAEKLFTFLLENRVDILSKRCLDIGASTGGFTQILLENGAEHVDAVDVGTMQLHETLRNDKRVISFENCDIREFKSEYSYELVTCDVSFVSVLYLLDSIDKLAQSDIIILYKPQFEVGKNAKRNRAGVVLDNYAVDVAKFNFLTAYEKLGWKLITTEESKLKGKEGNAEYFYHFRKH